MRRAVFVGAAAFVLSIPPAAAHADAVSASSGGGRHPAGVTCTIAGQVWNDGDGTGHGNGQIDAEEPGVEGVRVQLLKPDRTPVGGPDAVQRTASDGRYRFTDLPCADYRVMFFQYDNDQFTTAGVGSATTGSSAIQDRDGNGVTSVYTAGRTNGSASAHVNAGMLEAESGTLQMIGDRVWDDANGNGVQDRGEHGVAGVTVSLLNKDGSSAGEGATAVTNSDGRYLFTTLDIGTYRVHFSHLPSGDHFTIPNNGPKKRDSDALPRTSASRTAETANIFVGSNGQGQNRTIDAGLIKP